MTSKKKIFISHNSQDKDLAELIAKLISKLSIKQVNLWFSSDNSAGGGFNPGDEWYNEIIRQINECDLLLALTTPNSIERPWIYYEAGFAKGIKRPVVPICLGIKREELKSPLNTFQAFQLSDKKSIDDFLTKLFHQLGFEYDSELSAKTIEEAIPKISSTKFDKNSKTAEKDIYELIENLRFDINQKLSERLIPATKKSKKSQSNTEAYSVSFGVFAEHPKTTEIINRDFIIEIGEDDTFQSITNSIYFNIQDLVSPFTYLEKWVIMDNKTRNFFVVREIADRIPARNLFVQKRTYTIQILDKPYVATDSKARI
jgi:hypothetical protein